MLQEEVERILAPRLEEDGLFIVNMTIVEGKSITVYADGMQNVSIGQCTALARHLREALGEAGDAYEITVSSPGLDNPFQHPRQYEKNLNKNVEVLLTDGRKLEGMLEGVDAEGNIRLREFLPKKGNLKAAKPVAGDVVTDIPKDQIKQTKKLIFI